MPTVIRESMMMGVATIIVAAQPTLPILASSNGHCHPADSVFDTNIFLSHAICPSLCRYGLAVTNLKPFEGLFGLSTKITRHTVCELAV